MTKTVTHRLGKRINKHTHLYIYIYIERESFFTNEAVRTSVAAKGKPQGIPTEVS